MKNFSIIGLSVFFLLSSGTSFAYTSNDVSNAQFLANQGIIVKQSATAGYRLDNTITRAEVVGMALKIKGVTLPSNYNCKNYFIDAPYNPSNNWICRAVELAADDGIISRANTKARPQDSITRAEALAIIMNAGSVTNLAPEEKQNYMNEGLTFFYATGWQEEVLLKAYHRGILITTPERGQSSTGTRPYGFFYNTNIDATRGEVFGFARNILTQNMPEQYDGFNADFGDVFSKTTLESSGVVYGFGNKVNIENTSGYKYSIHVEPVTTHFLLDPSESLEKKSWNGNPYYSTMVAGMCYTGKLIFLGNENTILITGACNESIEEVEAALRKIYFQPTDTLRGITSLDVLSSYYKYLSYGNNVGMAYDMRLPVGAPLEIFKSWYKNVTSVIFREDTVKDLGDNTYEFLIDMTENGVKSTYKVKSKVDLENFKINNLSSVKQ